ncbi:MAG: sensor domain-containing diguanylate cyclase [Lachnospiraceae bacterium]|nr:sensor domain-containing diguanylate cyclase [Lachnospiraceae bacterium]
MSEFFKNYKYLIIILLFSIFFYIGSFFWANGFSNEGTAKRWAQTLESKVDSITGDVYTTEKMCLALEDVLEHFYVGEYYVPVTAFYRGSELGNNGTLFYSTLDECPIHGDGGENDKRTIEGYLKAKGIYKCYKEMISTSGYGLYDHININNEKCYIIYCYSSKLHAVVMGFVPKKCAESGYSGRFILHTVSFVLIVLSFLLFVRINKKVSDRYKKERDEVKQTMKDKDARMDVLSYLMNEFTFEYDIKHDTLAFAEKYQTIFQRGKYFTRFLENLKTRYNIYHLDQKNIQNSFDKIMNGEYEGSCLFRLQMPNGNYEWFNCVYKVMVSDAGEPVYVVGKIMNVHKSQTEKEMLLSRSTRDPLTNLLNRAELEKRTTNYINEMSESDLAAIVIMDLDHFKQVNDTMGHTKGDELLIEVAGLIRETFRTSDIIGRLGGDEFYIFMKDLANEADAISKCEKLRTLLNRDVVNGDKVVNISTSIGIHYVKQGATFLDIYMKADSALYRAKESGKNRYCIHREGDEIKTDKI